MNQHTLRTFDGISPRLGARVLIDPTATVIGDVHLGDDSSVWPQATIRGDVHHIRIGARCSIQDGAVLHVTHAGPHTGEGWPLLIGDDVTIGHHATLHGCHLGNRILIGLGARIMDGVRIDDGVVVGAGSLVPPGKHLQGGQLYVGSPARPARALTQAELDYFEYTAAHYVRLKNRYLAADAESSGD